MYSAWEIFHPSLSSEITASSAVAMPSSRVCVESGKTSASRVLPKAEPVEVVLVEECRIGFEVRYDNGQVAEVSWAFIRELPPRH